MLGVDLLYKVVYGSEMSYLERSVQELIRMGWVPHGGVAVPGGNDGYYQAMTSTKQGREAAAAAFDY
jgi:hypothetical protein